jgi:pyruvate formate lyase activating enzyme
MINIKDFQMAGNISLPIFDIQHLSTHDGKGLRTVVFVKGCPLHCAWCSNPEGQAAIPELGWHELKCTGCFDCWKICANKAVFKTGRPSFDKNICRSCEDFACVYRCPNGALKKFGRELLFTEFCEIVQKDLRLYWNSGGGVTFSGGEPLLYTGFIESAAVYLEKYGVGTAIETCGYPMPENTESLFKKLETIFWDVKSPVEDEAAHIKLTGVSNQPILQNLEKAAEKFSGKITISIPMIPGLVNTNEKAEAVENYCRKLGIINFRRLEYHEMGKGKYELLGRKYFFPVIPT